MLQNTNIVENLVHKLIFGNIFMYRIYRNIRQFMNDIHMMALSANDQAQLDCFGLSMLT